MCLKSSKLKLLTINRSNSDIGNFASYPDSDKVAASVKKSDDPFLDWFK